MTPLYYISFASGDCFAGSYDEEYSSLDAARDAAERRQAVTDEAGNPYRYRYAVVSIPSVGPSRAIYTTRSTPHQPGESLADYRERRRQANPQS